MDLTLLESFSEPQKTSVSCFTAFHRKQDRRRRKKEEESTELSKLDEVVYMDVDEKKFIWEKKFNFKPSKVNTSEGGMI